MNEYTKLGQWCNNHIPKSTMIWREPWYNAYSFWDFHILPMFSNSWQESHDLDRYHEEINEMIDIVGEHWSKSIIHPVMRIIYKGVTIVFRYNFYDYNITVISPFPLSLPVDALSKSENRYILFHEGFPDEYVVDGRYNTNQSEFMASVRDHYDFYTFMFLLKQEIDNKSERTAMEDSI